MGQDLHKLTVSIEAQINQFKKACGEVKRDAADAADSANKSLGGISDKKSANAVQKTLDKMKRLSQMMKEFGVSAKLNAGLIGPTRRAAELQVRLEAAQTEAEQCKAALDRMGSASIGTDEYVELTERLANAKTEAFNLEAEIRRLGVSGSFDNLTPPSFIGDLKAYAAEAREVASQVGEEFRRGFRMTAPPGFLQFMQKIGDIKNGIKDAGSSMKRFAVGAKNDLVSAGRHLGSLLSKIPLIGRIRGHTNAASAGFRQMRRSIISTALALAGAVFGFNAVRQGMSNLEQYSAQTRNDLNMLRSSLLTCQNALATAFAPVLSVVAPILAKLIDWITAAATAVAHFFAALTGQSFVVIARKASSGVATGMSEAAGATNDANSAAKEYKRTLMGFDKINKLDDQPSSGGSGDGGGGGSGGVGAPGSMFDTVEIGSQYADLANKIKEAWANADFYDIGRAVGEKLRDGLNSIDWDAIQAIGNKVATCIATGLNGFLETPGLFTAVGTTLAQALNTVFGVANTFATVFHWDSLGRAVSDTINAFFKTFKFDQAAETISNIALGILEFFTTAIKETDWENIGKSIIQFLANIKWVELFKSAAGLLSSIATAIGDLFKGAFSEATERLAAWMEDGQIWKDLFDTGSAVLDLGVNLVGAGWDIIKAISSGVILVAKVTGEAALTKIQKAWAGIKGKTKKITATAKTKGYNMLKKVHDAWNGIKGKSKEIAAKAKTSGVSALAKLKEAWASIKNGAVKTLTARIDAWKDSLKNKILPGFKANLTSWKDSLKNKVISFKGKITSIFGAGWDAIKAFVRGNAGGGVYKNGRWQPVQAAASGGSFDQGQFFVARERGPELVGTIGSHTAVMNNSQIVSSVAAGVAEAVASVLGGKQNATPVAVYLEGDAGKLFRVIRVEAQKYTNSTGKSAFPV